MGNVLEIIKNNKKKFIVAILLIIIVVIGLYMFKDNKKKEYILTEVLEYKYYLLNKDNKYGVIDTYGNIVIEPKYDNIKIPNPEKTIFVCENQDKTINVLNDKQEKIFEQYEDINVILVNGVATSIPYEKTVLKYKKDGKYGIVSLTGKEITKPIYEEITGLENKESELLVKKNGKYGVINVKGAKLIDILYDNIVADGFYTDAKKYGLSGYIVSNKTNDGYKYGYIDYKHKLVLNLEYDVVNRIVQNNNTNDVCIIVCKNGQYGVVKNNNVIINYSYQGIEYDKNNNFFELQRNEKYGIVDYNGKSILPIDYNEIQIQGMYIRASKTQDEDKIFNTLGEEIKNLELLSVQKTDNNNYYITIDKDGLYGVINEKNTKLLENKYNYLEYLFDDYFIIASKNGDLGVINVNEDIVIDSKYDILQKLDDTKVIEAKILKENRTELYSKEMKKIYSNKGAVIHKEDKYIKVYSIERTKYFDLNGKELQSKEVFTNNQLLANEKDGKWGFIDRNGNVVVDYKYDRVTEFNSYGYAGIMNNNKWGVVYIDGRNFSRTNI